jgi:phage-related protein
VTFSGEPDKRQMARVIGAVTLNKVSRNLDLWRGEVQFYCQPLKERIYKETSTVSRGGVIRNTGDVAEKPLITVVNTSANFTVGVGSRGIIIAAPSTGMQFKIDCDAQIVIYANDNAMELVSAGSRFPELAMGENILTGSGWSSATVERRERFL